MKKVLVTGAGGFLGMPFIQELAKEKKFEIYAVTSGRRTVDFPAGVYQVAADLLDRSQSKEVIERIKPSHMVHLAWDLSGNGYLNSNSNLIWLEESLYLLRTFIEAGGTSFAFAGSSAEYGSFGGFSENGATLKRSLYGHCKNAFHETAEKICKACNIGYMNLRFFSMLGCGIRDNVAVAKAIVAFDEKKEFVCKAPNNVWDFISVRDAAMAAVKAVDRGYEGAVNIASGKPRKMGDVFADIAKKMNAEALLTFTDSQDDYEIIVADITALDEKLGYHCQISYDEMLNDLIESVRRDRAKGE